MQVGDIYKTSIKYSQDEVELFAKITGDSNPLHLSKEFAAKTIFEKPIIHGFLSASIFSKILGMDFPGEGTIYLKQSLLFMKPMFVDVEYEVFLTVINLDQEKHRALIETKIVTIPDKKVTISGEALIQNNHLSQD